MTILLSCISLFIIGSLGFIFISQINQVLKLVLSLELILLGATLLVLGTAYQYDDLDGQLLGLYLIVLAGVESIVGLSLIIQYYSIDKSTLTIN